MNWESEIIKGGTTVIQPSFIKGIFFVEEDFDESFSIDIGPDAVFTFLWCGKLNFPADARPSGR